MIFRRELSRPSILDWPERVAKRLTDPSALNSRRKNERSSLRVAGLTDLAGDGVRAERRSDGFPAILARIESAADHPAEAPNGAFRFVRATAEICGGGSIPMRPLEELDFASGDVVHGADDCDAVCLDEPSNRVTFLDDPSHLPFDIPSGDLIDHCVFFRGIG